MTIDVRTEIKRLNWGCGMHPTPGWLNSDLKQAPGIDISCDLRDGLPIEDDALDYVASNHALPMIAYPDLVPALGELRRVLRPGGVLRLILPDLDRAIAAYLDGDRDYFMVPDEDEPTTSGKAIVHLLWYGWSVSMFTEEFTRGLLLRAGFRRVVACSPGVTASPFPEIVALDSREHESLFIEAVK